MKNKKKLDLKELELQLPSIESNETKIIIGGNDYDDGYPNTGKAIDTSVAWDFLNNGGGSDTQDNNGDYDHFYDDYQNAGGEYDDTGNTTPGSSNFSLGAALSAIQGQVSEVYNGLSQIAMNNLISLDSDFNNNPAFGHQLANILATNSFIANAITDLTELGGNIKFDIVSTLPSDTAMNTSVVGSNIVIQINSSLLDSLGWNANITDNASVSDDGIDYSVLTANQDFVATLMHEMLHAEISAKVIYAQNHVPNGTTADVRDYMLNVMHVDPAIVNTAFTVTQSGNNITAVSYNNDFEGAVHAWMKNPNSGVTQEIMASVNEFIADMQNLQHAVDNLSQLIDFAQGEANPHSPSNPTGGDAYPSPAEWQKISEGLKENLNNIKNDWGGWLNYNGH